MITRTAAPTWISARASGTSRATGADAQEEGSPHHGWCLPASTHWFSPGISREGARQARRPDPSVQWNRAADAVQANSSWPGKVVRVS